MSATFGRRGLALAILLASAVQPAPAQESSPPGRDAALALEFPPLVFQPPQPDLHGLPGGVEVLFLRDAALPLVRIRASFRGGYGRLPRAYYAAGTSLPILLRNGGTESMPPDSVDRLLEFHAIQTTFGGSGGGVSSSIDMLSEKLQLALELWGEMLRSPRFDPVQVEVWRGQELESVSRRMDDPGRLAFSEFNRLMYGDHPIGWEMSVSDLKPDDLTEERLRWVYRRIVCPENLILGVSGDVTWDEIEPLLTRLVEGWPACSEPLPPAPTPAIREGGGVFLIPRDLEQSTVVLAHPTEVRRDSSVSYFASRIGNSVLGAAGLRSRLMSRVRSEEGYAYSASSLWTAPRRYPGLVGAITRTSSATTVEAVRLVLETIDEMTRAPPTDEEVATAIEEMVNGFVFNFESAAQIVARRMASRAEGLPEDWLERYLAGIQRVEPIDVLEVFRQHVEPEEMTVLVVGDSEAFTEPLQALGPVTILDPEAGR